MGCLQQATAPGTDKAMDKEFKDIPLSESNVSLKLAEIQRRCSELIRQSGDTLELTLEEPLVGMDDGNPYNRG